MTAGVLPIFVLLFVGVVSDWREAPLEDPDLYEGDILLSHNIWSKNAIAHRRYKWPNGVIPFSFSFDLWKRRSFVLRGMNHIEENTCIRFIPRNNSRDYIYLYRGKGCFSYVGRRGGKQMLSLGFGCLSNGTIIHELLHAVGFYHEHSRSDRDRYLTIHWQNIKKGMKNQFSRLRPLENTLYDEFDPNSVMLYGERYFSKDGISKTITAKDGTKLHPTWKKNGMSASDIKRVNLLYNCKVTGTM